MLSRTIFFLALTALVSSTSALRHADRQLEGESASGMPELKAWEAAEQTLLDCDNAMGFDPTGSLENATFSHQGVSLVNLTTFSAYCTWWEAVGNGPLAGFEIVEKSIGYDEATNAIVYAATITATNVGEGGPFPPTNLTTTSDYAFWAMLDDDYKIMSVKKIWNDIIALTELGWA